MWPDLAKFRHFGEILKVIGNFWGFIQYLEKFRTYFGKSFMPLGKFLLLWMTKYKKLSSHLVTLSISFIQPVVVVEESGSIED